MSFRMCVCLDSLYFPLQAMEQRAQQRTLRKKAVEEKKRKAEEEKLVIG